VKRTGQDVSREGKRRMDELRVEVGMENSFKKKLVKSKLKWAGYMNKIKGDENRQRDQMSSKWRGEDARKIENTMGGED